LLVFACLGVFSHVFCAFLCLVPFGLPFARFRLASGSFWFPLLASFCYLWGASEARERAQRAKRAKR
jgi:hypothetical protein